MTNSIFRNKYPYQSSTIYHVGASLIENFPDLSPFEKLEACRSIVFPFDYPTPENVESEVFKQYFEQMFISCYWEKYFKAETFESFEIQLYSKLLEIMPVYSQILSNFFYIEKNQQEALLNTLTETVINNVDTNGTHAENGTETNKRTSKNSSTNKNIGSAFPSDIINAGNTLGNIGHAETGNLSTGDDSRTDNDDLKRTINGNNSEKRTENLERKTTSGSLVDGMIKFDEHFSGIFKTMLEEFNCLFSRILF